MEPIDLKIIGTPSEKTPFLNAALSCYAANYGQEGFEEIGAICYEIYPAGLFKENTLIMRGRNLNKEAISTTGTLTNEDIEDLKEGGEINPQKVIKYLFSVAYNLLASNDAKP